MQKCRTEWKWLWLWMSKQMWLRMPKADAAADAGFPAAAAAAETAIRSLAVAGNDRFRAGCGGTQAADRERRAYRQGYRDGWNWG